MNPTAEPQIPTGPEPPRGRLETWATRLLPLAAAVSLGIFIASQRMSIERDLRVTVPVRVAPGDEVPVRVLLFGDLRAVTGARLVVEPVRLSLLDAAAQVVSGPVVAEPGLANTLEGSLAVPPGAAGRLRVLAQLVDQPEALAAEVPLQVRHDPGRLAPLPRRLRKLQRFSEAPVRADGAAVPPAPLRTRVEAGGCVPEQPCTLWVHVGTPPAALRVTPSASVSVLKQPGAGRAGAEMGDVVRAVVTVHGPEASCELVADRGGSVVARRALRLPVTLGVLSTEIDRDRAAGPSRAPQLRLRAEPGPCIVDAYTDGRWRSSRTHADCAAPFDPPRWPGPAPLRLQIRRDPFASDSASVVVMPSSGPTGLRALAQAAARRDPTDELARSCSQAGACPTHADRYLAALLSEGLVPVPPPASGMARAVGQLARSQARLRFATLLSLGLCALSLAALVARRGLSGGTQARAWMGATEDAVARTRRARRRGWLLVWACVAALMLAFVAVALYVLARTPT